MNFENNAIARRTCTNPPLEGALCLNMCVSGKCNACVAADGPIR